MEKKTIGKFISALRKANGMTQKELGEKLFVSDKTVSRWERDECTPELSLIPAIAEIFGITTDELLRGEKYNPKRNFSDDCPQSSRSKSDKQFKLMIENTKRKFKNCTLISVGISIFGLIAAMIANLGFSKGLIAFCISSAFFAGAEICQICFTINARVMTDDEDDTYIDKIQSANTTIIKNTVAISFLNLILTAFCLPLVTLIDGANFGLTFGSWIGYGTIFALVVFILSYIIYSLIIRNVLHKKSLIFLSEAKEAVILYNNKLLKKILFISCSIALILAIGIAVWNSLGTKTFAKKLEFDSCEDFKAFVESDYEKWYKEGYSHVDENGDVIVHVPIAPDDVYFPDDDKNNHYDHYPNKVYEKIYNSYGDVICEYYYNPDLYADIIFNESSHNKTPVVVITSQSYYDASNLFENVETVLYLLIAADLAVSIFVFVKKKGSPSAVKEK